MIKKVIVAGSLFVGLTLALPAYAQTPTPTEAHQGILGNISNFFSNMFHKKEVNSRMQTEGQSVQSEKSVQYKVEPSGGVRVMPSGMPNMVKMQEYRLNALVRAGKITEAQKTAILAEWTKVQNELKSFAKTQGIDESYVLGGGMAVMMEQKTMQQNGSTQMRMQKPNMQQGGMRGGGNQH